MERDNVEKKAESKDANKVEEDRCEHTILTHSLSVNAHTEYRSRQKRFERKELLPTGCVIEELEDKADLRVKCFKAQQMLHLRDAKSKGSENPMLVPVLLRASARKKAANFVVPPRQNDEMHHIRLLYRQSIHMPIYHLTKSKEVPINVAHYEVASLCNYSTKLFITSSPMFTVQYEICPPSEKVEEFTNPHLGSMSESLLKPATRCIAKTRQTDWQSVKLTTAYGIHSAVQRVIVTEKIQHVKKCKAKRQKVQMRGSAEYIPVSNACERVLLKAPEKQVLKLCSVDDSDKEPRKVTGILLEEVFYDAVDTCDISFTSSYSVEICTKACKRNK